MFGFVFCRINNLIKFYEGNLLICTSMNNQECKTSPQVVNVNGDEIVFLTFSIKTTKCSGSCSNTNHPYA